MFSQRFHLRELSSKAIDGQTRLQIRSWLDDRLSRDIASDQSSRVSPHQSDQWARRFKFRHLRRTVYVNCAVNETLSRSDPLQRDTDTGWIVGDGRAGPRQALVKFDGAFKAGRLAVFQTFGQHVVDDSEQATQPSQMASGHKRRRLIW